MDGFLAGLVILFVIGAFVAGVLVGRKHPVLVETAVSDAKGAAGEVKTMASAAASDVKAAETKLGIK